MIEPCATLPLVTYNVGLCVPNLSDLRTDERSPSNDLRWTVSHDQLGHENGTSFWREGEGLFWKFASLEREWEQVNAEHWTGYQAVGRS